MLKRKLTIGSPRALVEAGLRIGQIAAGNQHLLLDDIRRPVAGSVLGSTSESGGTRPAVRLVRRHRRDRPCGNRAWRSCRAVPSSAVGSCKPGTCTRMRSVPWRWISGSTVPSSLTRRSTIWIDCSTDWRMRSVIAAGGTVSRISPPPASVTSRLRWPLAPSRPPSGCDRSRSLVERVLQIGVLADADLDAVAARSQPGIADPGIAQRAADIVADLVELVFLDVVGIDLEQDCEPPCRSRPSTRWRCAHTGQASRSPQGRNSARRKGRPPAPSG